MNIEKYSERVRGFLQSAQTHALSDGHQQFTPEHVLKVLLDDDQGMASSLISRAGGDILPRGDTLLSGGDRLTALADASAARHVRAKLLELAANPAVCGASPAAAPGPPPP